MSSSVDSDVENFEKRLGLKAGFYDHLLGEDDWSFLIKLSALVEAACTHTLAHKFGYPAIEESFAYLEQANPRTGRIALLKKVGALYDHQAETLRALAELRNKVAHSIRNVDFSLKEHVLSLDSNQRKKLVTNFGRSLTEQVSFGGINFSNADFVLKYTKLAIWACIAEIIACLYLEVDLAEYKISQGMVGSKNT